MDNEGASVPVTNLDEEKHIDQQVQQHSEEVLEVSSPKGFLIPTTDSGKVYSPAPQLESTALDESVNDTSYCHSDGLAKTPNVCLESTRISSHCAPGEFELEAELSKVQEENDSRNPLNAGFMTSIDHSNSLPPDVTNKSSLESSILAESDSETGLNIETSAIKKSTGDELEESPITDKGKDNIGNLEPESISAGQEKLSGTADNVTVVNGESEEVVKKEYSLLEDASSALVGDAHNETSNSDPEVEQLMKLPDTVTELVSKEGVKIYIVGTAHFSQESQEDVAKTILMTRPRVVVVELCVSRLNILRFDEQTILEEAKNLNMDKIRSTIKQYGAVQGALYLLFLSTSAHLTRQLGMAPGGEFRRAWHEARNVPGCRIHLGDRPIHVTLHRALAALSLWQKAKLVWHLLLNRSPISAEDVERCKQKDLLEEMLEEMTGEFPPLSRVFVQERDLCLAHSMQLAATDAAKDANLTEPPTVVGVVGIGHVAGMSRYFGHVTEADVRKVMKIPPPSRGRRIFVVSIKLSLAGLLCYGCYKIAPKVPLPFNLPSVRNIFSR
nr:EOG090X0AQH [Eurycercus lamellatus]